MPAGTERFAHPPGSEAAGWGHLTLAPLRGDGPESLNPEGLEPIAKITLRLIEAACDNGCHETIIKSSDDLFRHVSADHPEYDPIPTIGQLTRAVFEIQLAASARQHAVQIRPPYVLILDTECDPQLIERWLRKRGFRTPEPDPDTNGPPDQTVAIA